MANPHSMGKGVGFLNLKNLYLDMDLGTAINEPHIHHQLFPDYILFESQISEAIFPQKVNISNRF